MKVSPHHHHHHHHLGLRPHCVWTRGHCVVRGRQSQRQPGGGLPLPSLLLRACKCLQAPAAAPAPPPTAPLPALLPAQQTPPGRAPPLLPAAVHAARQQRPPRQALLRRHHHCHHRGHCPWLFRLRLRLRLRVQRSAGVCACAAPQSQPVRRHWPQRRLLHRAQRLCAEQKRVCARVYECGKRLGGGCRRVSKRIKGEEKRERRKRACTRGRG